VFRKTGESAKINGVICDRYLDRDAFGVREAWVSLELGELRKVLDLLHNQMLAATGEPAGLEEEEMWQGFPDGLPILFKELTPGGSLSIEEIKSLRREKVDARLFEVPAGYVKIALTDMMRIQTEERGN
jgi:hypothetical protein